MFIGIVRAASVTPASTSRGRWRRSTPRIPSKMAICGRTSATVMQWGSLRFLSHDAVDVRYQLRGYDAGRYGLPHLSFPSCFSRSSLVVFILLLLSHL